MDWYDRIEQHPSAQWDTYFNYNVKSRVSTKHYPEGSTFFFRRSRRGKRRVHRRRYVVCRSNDYGRLYITNAEIRFRKSKNAWGIFIEDEPVAHYRTLRSAKLALMPGVLDRMGAEGDRCLDPPCSAQNLKDGA